MSRIFLSHSSKDNPEAVALRDWLQGEGWNDLFLDLDPVHGIAPGERWERALHKAADRCEAVIFLISHHWLTSDWCGREFDLAARLSKHMFAVVIDDTPITDIPARYKTNWQFTSLWRGEDGQLFRAVVPPDHVERHVVFSRSGLAQLRIGLVKAGLDPRFFAWPPDTDRLRAPYRGLLPLEAADAGIFFGREASIVPAMDRLRDLTRRPPPRLLAILGASGAGKSSFLRAGLLPRLERDDRLFRPLPVLRPERAAISGGQGLVESLLGACRVAGLKRPRAEIKEAVQAPANLLSLLQTLAEAARVPALPDDLPPELPTLVLAIDQAEELFQADGAAEAGRFLDLVRTLVLAEQMAVLVILTIRTDAYESLQAEARLVGLRQETFSLPPMPLGAFKEVIEGPAQRLSADGTRRLDIDPALTQELLADVAAGGGRDVLPLLAFTLERLWHNYGDGGRLSLQCYADGGGFAGAIAAAVERAFLAADFDPAVPREREARLALLRRGLIPWLAGIDPATNEPRRKLALWNEIPEESRPLFEHLVAVRLLARDRHPGTGAATVEPAHEAILRLWPVLRGWLADDLGLLSALDGVQQAARDWRANGENDGWLSHAAGRLEGAESLRMRPDLGARLSAADWTYLAACRRAEDDRRNSNLAAAHKIMSSALAQALAFRAVDLAESTPTQDDLPALLAYHAYLFNGRSGNFADGVVHRALRAALGLPHMGRLLRGAETGVSSLAFDPTGRWLAVGEENGTISIWDISKHNEISALLREQDQIPLSAIKATGCVHWLGFGPAGQSLVAMSDTVPADSATGRMVSGNGGVVQLWSRWQQDPHPSTIGRTPIFRPEPWVWASLPVTVGALNKDSSLFVFRNLEEVEVWRLPKAAANGEAADDGGIIYHGPSGCRALAFSSDSEALVGLTDDGRVNKNSICQPTMSAMDLHLKEWVRCGFSRGASLYPAIAIGIEGNIVGQYPEYHSGRGPMILWTFAGGETPTPITLIDGPRSWAPKAIQFSNNSQILACSDGRNIYLWYLTWPRLPPIIFKNLGATRLAFNPNSDMLASNVSNEYRGYIQGGTDVRLWPLQKADSTKMVLTTHPEGVWGIRFSPDGKKLASCGADQTVKVFDLRRIDDAPLVVPVVRWQARLALPTLPLLSQQEATVGGAPRLSVPLAFSQDSQYLAFPLTKEDEAGEHESLLVVDLPRVDLRCTITPARQIAKNKLPLYVMAGSCAAVAFKPELDQLTTINIRFDNACRSNTAYIMRWNFEKNSATSESEGPIEYRVGAIIGLSSDGKSIASLDFGTLHGRSQDDVTCLSVFTPELSEASLAICRSTWRPSIGVSLAFRDDGEALGVGCDNGEIRVWNMTQPASEPVILFSPRGCARVLALSPDGKTVASGGDDGTIRVFRLDQACAIPIVLHGHKGEVTTLAFSPDGRVLASGGNDGGVWLWIADMDILARIVRSRLGRSLTLEEWNKFIAQDLEYEAIIDVAARNQNVADAQSMAVSDAN